MSERLKYWTDNDDHEPLIFDDQYLLKPTDIVAKLNELTAANADLKQRNEALEDVDDVSSSYMKLAKKAIEALSGYSFRDDFQKEFDELQKEFEEIKNA